MLAGLGSEFPEWCGRSQMPGSAPQSCEALPRTRLVNTSRPTEDRPDTNLCSLVPAASDQPKLIADTAADESSYKGSRLFFRARPRSAEWELEVSTLVVV